MATNMEFLNKIELRGVVGRVNVSNYGGRQVANFSLVTEYSYASKDGGQVRETMWWQVTAWDSPKNQISNVEKGDFVYVLGRMRQRAYTGQDGEERRVSEVVATEVEIEGKHRED